MGLLALTTKTRPAPGRLKLKTAEQILGLYLQLKALKSRGEDGWEVSEALFKETERVLGSGDNWKDISSKDLLNLKGKIAKLVEGLLEAQTIGAYTTEGRRGPGRIIRASACGQENT